MTQKLEKLDDAELTAVVVALREHGTLRKAAVALGESIGWTQRRLAAAKKRGLVRKATGSIAEFETKPLPLPAKGHKRVYILSSAQNHTKLHPCWPDLLALAAHDNAQIMVSAFVYNKDAQGQRAAAKSDAGESAGKSSPRYETRAQELAAEYPHEIIPYICDDRVALSPNLVFCGELNVLPTAEDPLSGLESYTYRQSTIVPHPKLALQSVPAMPGEGVKLMYTTGCITQRNYIKRKVGYKAEHFHSYGALLVEIDDNGSWWCRQLQVGTDGAIYDMDRRVKNGKVTTGHRVENVCLGDVHSSRVDEVVADVTWGRRPDSLLEVLKPKSVHVHDVLDFSGRSHHTRKDPHAVFKAHHNGEWILTDELRTTARVLWVDIAREWCDTFVVNSNHDRHLDIFLKEMDWRNDPANARMILSLNLQMIDAIVRDEHDFLIMERALKDALGQMPLDQLKGVEPGAIARVRFLKEDESNVILPKIEGGIEAGLHCDRGANGAKGSIAGISRIDRKVNGADKHTIAIKNHAYFAGTSGRLKQGWNHGLSSWTAGHTITYVNGTRAIYSVWKGKWRA